MMPIKDKKIQLNAIEEAIADIREGKVIIVVDDENREMKGILLPPQKRSPRK